MRIANADSSLEGKSSDDLKQMMREQTSMEVEDTEDPATSAIAQSDEVSGEVVEVVEEPAATPTEEVPQAKPEQPAEEVVEEVPKKDIHKLKVEGKEEEVDYERLIQYAQKGRHYEKEMQRLKEEKERLGKSPATSPQMPSIDKINEELVENLSKNAFGTLTGLLDMWDRNKKELEAQERRLDKEFERDKKGELPHWEAINHIYRDFRDLGYDRDRALLAAERDYFMDLSTRAKASGVKEGAVKTTLKQKAELPVKEKKAKVSTSIPTPEEAANMSSAEIAKYLKRHKVAGW